MTNLLANPIWHSLSTEHASLALGNHLAKRYPDTVGPLAGMQAESAECWEALRAIAWPGDQCVLFLNEPIKSTAPGLRVLAEFPIAQMLCASLRTQSSTDIEIEKLGEKDVPEMMSLAALTEPGPFRRSTIELGGYVGIRDQGRLVAMAGQRGAVPGYREVSAVCTHPGYRGKGNAAVLVSAVAAGIAEHGELPYLHVRKDNLSAIRLYQRLGFRTTRTLHCAILTSVP